MRKIIALCLVAAFVLAACGTTEPTAAPVVPGQPNERPTATPLPDSAIYDPAHLAKLLEGLDAWNAWRVQNPDVKPDLMRADLRGRNLADYDLTSASLLKANLSNANLSRAILRAANLNGANLTGAKLKNARLSNARLIGTDLTGADLTGAKLTGARYDATTIWPAGFDPIAAGAVLDQ